MGGGEAAFSQLNLCPDQKGLRRPTKMQGCRFENLEKQKVRNAKRKKLYEARTNNALKCISQGALKFINIECLIFYFRYV